jgi:hypothetical protein
MNTSYTPKEYILNVLNQCLVSLQETDDFEIMKPEIIKAARLVQNLAEKPKDEKPDTPDIDSIAETNYENRRT